MKLTLRGYFVFYITFAMLFAVGIGLVGVSLRHTYTILRDSSVIPLILVGAAPLLLGGIAFVILRKRL
ncbi:MAG: LPXTG cell wall anchor domain-containing protein [Capsulimonas sp.]|uniref:LPXTG cell wall anchor domain-containing protein n=1 Tax=Capsulimonas sp. TaxID=2494211 RepID=UPI003263192C